MIHNLSDGEWRVQADVDGILDPTEAIFNFVYVKDGKIVGKIGPYSGFCHNAKKKLKEILEGQLAALDRPFIKEVTTKKIVEFSA
jgi:hypothetical protein